MTWDSTLEWVGDRTQWQGQLYELVEERGRRDDRGRPGPVGWHLHLVHDNGNTDPEPVTGLLSKNESRARRMAELITVDGYRPSGSVYGDGDPKWLAPGGQEWRQSDLLAGRHRDADEAEAAAFEMRAAGVEEDHPEDFRDIDGGVG